MTLEPHEVGQNHRHSQLFEAVIGAVGEIVFFIDGQAQPMLLLPGQQASVDSPQAHGLENHGDEPAQYVLVQNGGADDFVPAL